MSFQLLVGHSLLHSASTFISPVQRTAEYLINCAVPNVLPSPESIIDLGLKGWVREDAVEQVLCSHGISVDLTGANSAPIDAAQKKFRQNLWTQAYYAKMELPSPHDLFTLANRGFYSPAGVDQGLRRLGFYSATIRDTMANLRYEIPSSSDLVRFSVRHVFEPDLVAYLGYNDEFNRALDVWHGFQGLNYPIWSGPFAGSVQAWEKEHGVQPGSFRESYTAAGLTDPTWAQAFWWSHWVLPSATQGYEMYFRYRPDRDRRFDPPGTSAIDFGDQDLNLLLRANDYPPHYRPLLAGIAHRLPGVRFLRQLRATDVFSQQDVYELLRRQGYSDGDAKVLAESVERNDRDIRRRSIEQQAKGQLAKYWEVGVIDQNGYKDLLVKHGMTPADADDTAQLAVLDLQFKRVEKIIAYVKRQFTSGAITAAQATGQLRQAGIVNERVSVYIDDWQLEVQVKHKTISAQKAVQLACKGLITVIELQTRLANLGYQLQDAAVLTQEATLCQAGLAARAAAAASRAARQQQLELKRQQREAAQAIVTARRQLASHGTPAQLRKWYCEGHLGELEVYSRLRYLGWPDADITRLIGDCKSATSGSKGGQRGGSTIGSTTPATGPVAP